MALIDEIDSSCKLYIPAWHYGNEQQKAIDLSGNDNHGLIYGAKIGPTFTFLAKNWGYGYYFNGKSDYIRIKDDVSLRPNNLTIMLWFMLLTFERDMCLLSKITLPAGPGWIIQHYTTQKRRIQVYFYNGDTFTAYLLTSSYLELNKWYNVCVTHNGSEAKLYLNGKLESSDSDTTLDHSDHDLYIGCMDGQYRFANAIIGEVRLYSRVLSDSEIKEKYDVMKKLFCC